MKYLSGAKISEKLDGIIAPKNQVHDACVDLTVSKIQRFTKRGSLDFGGSEFRAAHFEAISSKKLNSDDKYGWWELSAGLYRLSFNEQISDDNFLSGYLTPHPRLIQAGCFHSSMIIEPGESLEAVLQVPEVGCALKENCRVSRLQLFV